MTLPSSFPISASQINVELGRAANAAFDIQGSAERALAEVPSGAISFSDFLGKTWGPTFLGAYGPVNNSASPSFAGVSFGTAASTRTILVGIHYYNTGINPTLNSATIGGISASILVDKKFTYNSGGGGGSGGHASDDPPAGQLVAIGVAIISANVPTGTSGTVNVSFNTSVGETKISAFRFRDVLANTTTASGGSGGNSASASISVPSAGFLLPLASATSSASMNISPGTAQFNETISASRRMSGAIFQGSGAQTMNANQAGGSDIVLAGVAWN